MKRRSALAGGVLAFLVSAGAARADLKHAHDLFLHGNYKEAETEARKLGDPGALELARIEVLTGRYAQAEKLARASSQPDAAILLGEILRTTGRYADAEKVLEPLVKAHPDLLRARYVLGRVYRDVGDARDQTIWNGFVDDYNKNKINLDDAQQLFYCAEAARYLTDYDSANATYRDSVDHDKTLFEANLEWGHLFLEKYAPAEAEQSFDEVLKIDPRNPDAHAGMAAVKLDPAYDLAGATAHIEQALAVNPRHVPALLLRAGIEIDQNQWDKAKATLAEVLAVNPVNLEAHARLATVAWLRDDMTTYQAEKKTVFGVNPTFARFFHIVAQSAEREHRYKQAIELEREAVATDPHYYEAMESIGAGYLRLGVEKDGIEWLRKSWAGDQYNMRTKNQLDLFEDMIPRDYSFATSKDFKIRYHNDEKPLFRRYIEPLLERGFADMVKRYGFTPQTPVVVELFQDADQYSVRTIGLPNLGALGICFGQVITAMSPSVGDINWGMVLWHELSHVFAIQLSNSRVPRWFTEGLSEYETVLARPEWRRENDADVWAAIEDNALPKIAELNYGFMKPDMQQVVVAYHLASLCIEFLARTYGFPKIVLALKLYGQGLETPAVLEKVTGKKLPELDAEFRRYLDLRLAPYKGTFHVPIAGMDDMKRLTREAAAAPRSALAQARLALGHFYEGEAAPARQAADRALGLDPHQTLAIYVKAELTLRDRDLAAAKTLYEALLHAGADSFDIRSRLGTIDVGLGNLPEAEQYFCTAKRLDPERSFPYQALADLYEKQGRTEDALRELETYVMIEQMQAGPVMKLVQGYVGLKRWDKVRTFGEMGVEINPENADLLLALGQAYLETGDPAQALYSFDSALMVRPEMRRPALAQVGRGRALLAQGNKKEAGKAADLALKAEPDNADALALRKQLAGR